MTPNTVMILEGPDGSGKTTLARRICDDPPKYVYRHEGPPPPGRDQLHYYGSTLLEALRMKRPRIFDRLHLGEYVYGPVCRNRDLLTRQGVRLMKRLIRAHDVKCWLVMPSLERVLEHWEARRGKEYVRNRAQMLEIYYRYAGLVGYYPTYDPFTEPYEKLWINEVHPVFSKVGEAIGNPRARFLVVGEQSNTELDLPFFSLGNSSRYLNLALDEAGFRERDLAFTNAITKKDKYRDLAAIRQDLPNFCIAIALGRFAAKACRVYNLPHIQIMHPSCNNRFHQENRHLYVAELEKIRASFNA